MQKKQRKRLDFEAIKDLIEKPVNYDSVRLAQSSTTRALLYSEQFLSPENAGESYTIFLKWISSFTIEEKIDNFKSFVRFPLPTSKIFSTVKTEISKAIEAVDKYTEHRFDDPEKEIDFNEYLESLENAKTLEHGILSKLFTRQNDFIAIVQPEEPLTPPRPYPVNISIFDIVDFGEYKKGEVDYLIYKENNFYYAIDSFAYHRVEIDEDGKLTPNSYINPPHSLGYAPVRQYSKHSVSENTLVKKGILTDVLYDFDHLLFKSVAKFDNESLVLYPKMWMVEQRCTYEDYEGLEKIECFGGDMYLRGYYDEESGKYSPPIKKKCLCSEKKKYLRGAGSSIEVPAPREDGEKVMTESFGFVSVDGSITERVEENIALTEKTIIHSVVGRDGMEDNKQHNELRVKGTFESKQNVLKTVANSVAEVQHFIYYTLGKIRYDGYLDTICNAGNNFFIHNVEQLKDSFIETAKEGISFYQDILGKKIVMTEFKNNPAALHREKMKSLINPYYYKTTSQLEALKDSIGQQDYLYYVNLDHYISLMEAEINPINKIAIDAPIAEKARQIKEFTYQLFLNNNGFTKGND